MIANAVSQPGKIIVTAQAASGSLANVTGIAGGAIESGLSQADVANWAFTGKGVFEGKPNVPGLRLIANPYPESVHLVVRKGSGIKSVADLKGKRVAMDEPGMKSPRRCSGMRRKKRWRPAMPRAGSSTKRTRSRAPASPSTPGLSGSTTKPAC